MMVIYVLDPIVRTIQIPRHQFWQSVLYKLAMVVEANYKPV